MRIVLDSSIAVAGGVSRHLFDVGSGLIADGIDVKLQLPNADASLCASAEERGLQFASPREIRRTDAVHLHLADTFDGASLIRLIRYRRFAPTFVTEHLPHSNASDPGLPLSGHSSLRRDGKTLFKHAQFAVTDSTIVLSSSCRQFMARRYRVPAQNFLVIPNGIPAITERLGPRDAHAVIAIGALSAQKGFDTLIRAAATQGVWSAKIYGEGTGRESLQNLITELSAPVQLMGWTSADDIPFCTSALLAVPSRWEALPYVVMEAMWHSLPIVASRVDGLPDLVIEGSTGLLTKPGESLEFAIAINRLTSFPESAQTMGQAGRDHVKARFSYETMINSLARLYSKVTGGRAQRH